MSMSCQFHVYFTSILCLFCVRTRCLLCVLHTMFISSCLTQHVDIMYHAHCLSREYHTLFLWILSIAHCIYHVYVTHVMYYTLYLWCVGDTPYTSVSHTVSIMCMRHTLNVSHTISTRMCIGQTLYPPAEGSKCVYVNVCIYANLDPAHLRDNFFLLLLFLYLHDTLWSVYSYFSVWMIGRVWTWRTPSSQAFHMHLSHIHLSHIHLHYNATSKGCTNLYIWKPPPNFCVDPALLYQIWYSLHGVAGSCTAGYHGILGSNPGAEIRR